MQVRGTESLPPSGVELGSGYTNAEVQRRDPEILLASRMITWWFRVPPQGQSHIEDKPDLP